MRKIYFRKSAHVVIMEAGKFEIYRAFRKLKHTWFLYWSLEAELPLPQETSLVLKAFHWLDEAHPHYGG